MKGRSLLLLGAGLVLAGVVAAGAAYAVGPSSNYSGFNGAWGPGGMMGGGRTAPSSAPAPGQAGFVAGTQAAPRVVQIYAYPNDRFYPDSVTVQAGETVTFEVTTMGPTTHEFMVGPAADVAADKEGTPEVTDLSMMQTKTLTYTFNGSGPFAFACHAPGHFEAGMKGTIVVQ